MADLLIHTSLTHTLLLVLPVACALLLRWTRCPGWPVVGGAVAGILLGPTLFGRIAPDAFERVFVGGVEERLVLDQLLRSHEAERRVSLATGRMEVVLVDLTTRQDEEQAAAERDLRDARWHSQRPLRNYVALLSAMILAGAGGLRVRPAEHRPGLVGPASIGLWAATLPAMAAATAMVWLWRHGPAEAMLAAAAVAIGPWVLTRVDRDAADEAEIGGAHLLQQSGRVASLAAIALAALALFQRHGPAGLVAAAPFIALPAGWLLPAAMRGRVLRAILDVALVPALAACVALRIDLLHHFALWPVVVFAILSGDGRWLGAFIGAMLTGGRPGLRTMRLVLGAMACGPTQLAVAAIAVHANALPETIILALMLGAILVEVTAPLRRAAATKLMEQEE